jgi:hypothetical protein
MPDRGYAAVVMHGTSPGRSVWMHPLHPSLEGERDEAAECRMASCCTGCRRFLGFTESVDIPETSL